MKFTSLYRVLILLTSILLGGCAASQMPGFQNAYQGYNVPEALVERIRTELKKYGLPNAQVARDNVGRIRLMGSYQDEDEVDRAYVIVQSIVGIKSTSPFYPENIKEKRWEADARRAIAQFTSASRSAAVPGTKRALIIGINSFRDQRLTDILGEDDARRVKSEAEKANYLTTTLLGAQATKANIEAALTRMKQEVRPNDTLLIYISSHGTLPTPSPRAPDARKMSIAAYDTGDASVRGATEFKLKVHATSVADTKVQELAQMPTRQTRVIIDTCYSGEILKGIPDEAAQYVLKTNGGVPERASISMAAWSGETYSPKGIVFAEDKPTKSAKPGKDTAVSTAQQADLSRYTIITATSDGQLSWGPSAGGDFESPVDPTKRLKGSFFTQAFFDYLGKNGGHIAPAFAAAQQFTYDKVVKIPPPNGPVQQRPRLNPPLQSGDVSSIYD
jgi:Caspase domain